MATLTLHRPLRSVMLIDAAGCALFGIGMLTIGDAIGPWFGLPATITQIGGLILLATAILLGYTATRPSPASGLIWAIIAINVLWVVESVLLPVLGWWLPTAAGWILLVVQAAVILGFTFYYWQALRQMDTRR